MEIPQEIQEKLNCSECDELLSCGPVYLLHETGGTICGRCSQQQEESNDNKNENSGRSRIVPYEAVASLLAFPCAFAARGCPEKVPFTLGRPPHELGCKFRPFICPIAPQGTCDWIDSWQNLKQHCDEKHPENSFDNPCVPPLPDLTSSNLQTYLISAFHFLFLLQIKVCVSTGKLFHCVRMFGDPEFLDKFSFSLDIEGSNIKLTKLGSVLRAGLLTIQEPTAICTTISSILDILGEKYIESKFVITIQTSIKLNCLSCAKIIDVGAKFCDECVKRVVKCKFSEKSCAFVDVKSIKCKKHAMYFCEYQTECFNGCSVNFVGSSIEHFGSSNSCCNPIKADINSVVRIPKTPSRCDYILFSSDNIGTITCEYGLHSSSIKVFVYTSLPSYELKNLKCSVEVTDPQTKRSKIFTPEIDYVDYYDWVIHQPLPGFPSIENIGIDMKININKI